MDNRAAVSFDDDRDQAGADPAVRLVGELGDGSRSGRSPPHEAAEPPRDRTTPVPLERLEPLLTMAEDPVGAGVDPCLGLGPFDTTSVG